MCAVVGYVRTSSRGSWPLTHRILNELLIVSLSRGRHATGFYAVRETRARAVVTRKRPLPADEFIAATPVWRGLGPCSVVLAHTRHATHGSPRDARNNHPFISDNGRFALVHNGIIANYRELAWQRGLRLTSDCDSEVLLRLVEQAYSPAAALAEAMWRCRGSLAVAVYDRVQHVVWLARNEGRPLVVCKLRGGTGWFVSSAAELMTTALRRALGSHADRQVEVLLPLAAGSVVGLWPDGSLLTADHASAEATLF